MSISPIERFPPLYPKGIFIGSANISHLVQKENPIAVLPAGSSYFSVSSGIDLSSFRSLAMLGQNIYKLDISGEVRGAILSPDVLSVAHGERMVSLIKAEKYFPYLEFRWALSRLNLQYGIDLCVSRLFHLSKDGEILTRKQLESAEYSQKAFLVFNGYKSLQSLKPGQIMGSLEEILLDELSSRDGTFYDDMMKSIDPDKGDCLFQMASFQENIISVRYPRIIKDITVLTYNRPRTLKRSLAKVLENLNQFGHRNVKITVFDHSDRIFPFGAYENYKTLRELRKKYAFKIRNIGPRSKNRVLNILADGLRSKGVQNADQIVRTICAPNYGGARNLIALVMSGHRFITLDDDGYPETIGLMMDGYNRLGESEFEYFSERKNDERLQIITKEQIETDQLPGNVTGYTGVGKTIRTGRYAEKDLQSDIPVDFISIYDNILETDNPTFILSNLSGIGDVSVNIPIRNLINWGETSFAGRPTDNDLFDRNVIEFCLGERESDIRITTGACTFIDNRIATPFPPTRLRIEDISGGIIKNLFSKEYSVRVAPTAHRHGRSLEGRKKIHYDYEDEIIASIVFEKFKAFINKTKDSVYKDKEISVADMKEIGWSLLSEINGINLTDGELDSYLSEIRYNLKKMNKRKEQIQNTSMYVSLYKKLSLFIRRSKEIIKKSKMNYKSGELLKAVRNQLTNIATTFIYWNDLVEILQKARNDGKLEFFKNPNFFSIP